MSGTLTWSDALWLARRRTPNDRLRFWGSALSAGMTAAVVCSALGLVALGGRMVDSGLGVVAEPGTRVGAIIAVFLVALPAVYLTGQTWKLGSVEQRERLLQLRDAGAGRSELRRVAVADALVPVTSGATVGVLVLGIWIALLNLRGAAMPTYRDTPDGSMVPTGEVIRVPDIAVVPNVAIVSWWPPLVAIAIVAAIAALASARSVRRMDRPARRGRTMIGWAASVVARRVRRPALLMALRRIVQEPRATTPPALLLGLAAFIAGVSTWLSRQFLAGTVGYDAQSLAFYAQGFFLVRVATWVGVGLCGLGLVVTLTDAVLRRRRNDAAAVAGGVPVGVLQRALVLQAMLPAVVPVVLALTLGGALGYLLTGPRAESGAAEVGPLIPLPWLAWVGWGVGILVVAVVAALIASTALRRTTQVDQLRVPA